MQAFRRRDSTQGETHFKLRELDANARYVVTNLDEPGAPQESTGSQLEQEGLLVVIPDKPGAALFTYRRKK